jgi:DNA-binding LacI/PurR family transcriptional regulator
MTRNRASLAEHTAETLRERIRARHKPGDSLPALRHLCDETGVSLNTVRAALALLAREGRVEIRHGAGVFVRAPAERLRVGLLSELNLLMPVCAYHRNLANETLLILRERGMTPHLFCGTVMPGENPEEPTCPEFWEAAGHQRLDGAIILSVPSNDPWYFRVEEMALPAVGEHCTFHVPHADVRVVDPGLRALARQGASRIALLTASRDKVLPLFEQGLLDLGLSTDPGWIAGELNPALPGVGWQEFRDVWRASDERPDGLLVTDDVLFSGAAEAIRDLRIDVPGQLRVATQANRGNVSTPPPFAHTRIEFDPRDFAVTLVDSLEQRLAGKRPPNPLPQVPYRMVEADGKTTQVHDAEAAEMVER